MTATLPDHAAQTPSGRIPVRLEDQLLAGSVRVPKGNQFRFAEADGDAQDVPKQSFQGEAAWEYGKVKASTGQFQRLLQ